MRRIRRGSPFGATRCRRPRARSTPHQRRFLAQLANLAGGDAPNGGDAWQAAIFSVAKLDDLPPRRAFEAIYLAFLGRPNGPRAGWLLASLDRDFVYRRTWEASGWTESDAATTAGVAT